MGETSQNGWCFGTLCWGILLEKGTFPMKQHIEVQGEAEKREDFPLRKLGFSNLSRDRNSSYVAKFPLWPASGFAAPPHEVVDLQICCFFFFRLMVDKDRIKHGWQICDDFPSQIFSHTSVKQAQAKKRSSSRMQPNSCRLTKAVSDAWMALGVVTMGTMGKGDALSTLSWATGHYSWRPQGGKVGPNTLMSRIRQSLT